MIVFDFEILHETDLDRVIWREIGAAKRGVAFLTLDARRDKSNPEGCSKPGPAVKRVRVTRELDED